MKIHILSLFPGYFRGPFDESILKRAQAEGLLEITQVDLRAFSEDKHKRVDDRPYGGGPGMVLMPQPVVSAVESVKGAHSKVIYLSPQGEPFTAQKAQALAQEPHLVLLCGHYEGIDQRAIDLVVDEEISIGDYVLTNGCLAAIVLVDAVARFIPGVLGHAEAASQDSFQDGLLDCPHYTRPVEFRGQGVPEVLQNGNHAEIARWRRAQAEERTHQRRPELYEKHKRMKKENEDEQNHGRHRTGTIENRSARDSHR